MINTRLWRVSKVEISENRNLNEGKEDREPSFARTIKITYHEYNDTSITTVYELDLYGSDDVKYPEQALKIEV